MHIALEAAPTSTPTVPRGGAPFSCGDKGAPLSGDSSSLVVTKAHFSLVMTKALLPLVGIQAFLQWVFPWNIMSASKP